MLEQDGSKFRVIVVDSRPKLEAKQMLAVLSQAGISCTYILINSLSYVMKEVRVRASTARGVLDDRMILEGCIAVTAVLPSPSPPPPLRG